MTKAEAIHFEFDPSPRLVAEQNCVFRCRVVNDAPEPLTNIWIWFTVLGTSDERHLPVLPAGQSPPGCHFDWRPASAGTYPIRIAVGLPRDEGGPDDMVVFVRELSAEVFDRRKGPENISVELHHHGGQYGVGDAKLVGVDLGVKKTSGRRRSSYRESAAPGADAWTTVELFRHDVESQDRSKRLSDRRVRADIEGRLRAADIAFDDAKTLKEGGDAADAELAATRAREAEDGFRAAHRLAEGLGDVDLARRCTEGIRAVRAAFPRASAPPIPETPAPQPGTTGASGVVWRVDGTPMEAIVITRPEVSWGRHSERDVFLAREPFERPAGEARTEDERNWSRSVDISREHFFTRWGESTLEIEDRSTNGTWCERGGRAERLPRGTAVPLAHGDRLHLAGAPGAGAQVLSLEVRFTGIPGLTGSMHDLPTGYARRPAAAPAAAVVRRLDNRPERAYVLLRQEATIGRNGDSAVVVQGEGIEGAHAALVVFNGGLALRRSGAGAVRVNGRELAPGETMPLGELADIELGRVPLRYRSTGREGSGAT